jgi:hypothetical protein
MFGVWKDELMQRRALLKLIGLASAAGLAPSHEGVSRPGKPTPETLQDLDFWQAGIRRCITPRHRRC